MTTVGIMLTRSTQKPLWLIHGSMILDHVRIRFLGGNLYAERLIHKYIRYVKSFLNPQWPTVQHRTPFLQSPSYNLHCKTTNTALARHSRCTRPIPSFCQHSQRVQAGWLGWVHLNDRLHMKIIDSFSDRVTFLVSFIFFPLTRAIYNITSYQLIDITTIFIVVIIVIIETEPRECSEACDCDWPTVDSAASWTQSCRCRPPVDHESQLSCWTALLTRHLHTALSMSLDLILTL